MARAMPILDGMKQITLSLALTAALALPVAAQQTEDDGFSLMEEGARLLFRGLIQEMEPALKELEGLSGDMELALRGFAQNMGPGLSQLLEQVEDFSKYHPPEILPNGDIIIRRKSEDELSEDAPQGDIEL